MPKPADRDDGSKVGSRRRGQPAKNQPAGGQGQGRRMTDPGSMSPEAALRASEERFRAILQSHPSAVVLVDSGGLISYANDRTAELLGYSTDELHGMPVERLVPDASRPGHVADREGYMADPHTRQMGAGRDLSIRRKDGRSVPVEIGLSSFESQGERYFIAVVADITTRKAAEAALRSTTGNLRALIAASPLATIVLDLNGAVQLWNPASERMFGWKSKQVLGKVLPHVPESELIEAREIIRRVTSGEDVVAMEVVRRRKDGRPVQAELFAAPQRDSDGRVVGIVLQLADITGRRQLEEALLQTQKMESIGRLAGGIAHDFNNTLTAISGFAQLLVQDLPPGSLEHDNAESISRAAGQAAALTQQLLAFSRRQVLQPRVLDPDETIRVMEPMLRRLIGEDVELRISLRGHHGRVRADPAQLQQVVMNLAVNARDAMPRGGRMAIETGRTSFDAAYATEHFAVSPGNYLMIAVSDNGIGMDKATRAHIFEPFFTTKELGKGTGLGLATTYGIVRQSGGHIWLYSEPGQGTTFKVYLPLVEEAISEPDAIPVDVAGGRETLLLVEDDDSVRQLARVILERKGYRVLPVSDPTDALKLVAGSSERIDLLVSDVVMPFLSGPELARRVRQLRPEIRALLLSGYTEELADAEGHLAGADAFLSKPFTAEDLARKVGEIADLARASRARADNLEPSHERRQR
jgi:two-component system, cell cycle sensor histidine kinase and response regulator CckA